MAQLYQIPVLNTCQLARHHLEESDIVWLIIGDIVIGSYKPDAVFTAGEGCANGGRRHERSIGVNDRMFLAPT